MFKQFEELESEFFRFVEITQSFGENIVFVGGWLPFLYSKHYWKNPKEELVFTNDLDLGIRHFFNRNHPETLEACFRRHAFPETPASDVDDTPVRFYLKQDAKQQIPIDVISADPDPGQFQRLTGKTIEVINSLDNFDILVDQDNTFVLPCVFNQKIFSLNVPHPAVYLFQKGITFDERSQKPGRTHKFKKDLWSIFFVLQSTPGTLRPELLQRILRFKDHREFPRFQENLKTYFKNRQSKGVLAVHSFYSNREKLFRDKILESVQGLLREIG